MSLAARTRSAKRLPSGGRRKSIADQIEQILDATGRNGGNILAKGIEIPTYLREFVEYVVPELQRRGLTKMRYDGTTLRENLN